MAKGHDYDVIVIGAGIAGMVSAVTATGLGKRVAVVEKGLVGGNCTNSTCIPSKTLIRLSHSARELARLAREGLIKPTSFDIDSKNVLSRIRSVVEKAHQKDSPDTFEQIGIRMLSGQASFVDRHKISVNGRTVSARSFIISAGTRPLVPPIPGLSDIRYLTNENLYELEAFPKSLIILGGGVDGLEYASAFGRLGVSTTVIQRGNRLLPSADLELVHRLTNALQDDGIRLMTGSRAVGVRREDGRVVLDVKGADGTTATLEAEQVLVALGRTPDIEGLCLENAGVTCTAKGIRTDKTLRTAAANIYACGDIVGPDQLASMAEYQGIVAATNAVLPVKQKVDYRNSVYVIFTEPPLAYIGLTEEQAHAKYGHKLGVYRFDYAQMRRALIDGATEGLAKFLCDGRGRLIGAHILGEGAGEVIHEAQVIKAMKKPLHRLNLVTHAYPTYAQALVGRASQLAFLDKMGGSLLVNAALKILPGFHNRLSLARDRLAEVHAPELREITAAPNAISEPWARACAESACKVRWEGDGACIIDLPEDLMDHDERPIMASLSTGAPKALRHVILNFARVRFMNGLGASMLVKLSARARSKGRTLSAVGAGEDLAAILRVTELDGAIKLYGTLSHALSACGITADASALRNEPDSGNTILNRANWSEQRSSLFFEHAPKEARNLNVNGRRAVGPVSGFGRLWQKVFSLSMPSSAATPKEAVAALKVHFSEFQPAFNRFYASPKGILPGEIVLIDSMTPGGPVSTGVVIMYADDLSFTFHTPEGHPECGFVSFRAREGRDATIVEIVGLARASDPMYEAAFRLAGSRIQTRIWKHVLTSLALHFGVPASLTLEAECVDPRLRWSHARNISLNAQVRTLIHEPKRWFRRA